MLASVVLGLSGATCLAVVVANQQHPSQPALSTADPQVGAGRQPAAVTLGSGQGKTGHAEVRPVMPASAPLSVTIPSIGVRSALLSLGQNSDGSVEVPRPGPHYDEAGWYRYSATPGSLGPAVIVGHVDSVTDGPSVFFHLASLRPGDTVLIARADGSVAGFTVDAVRRYHKTNFPTRLVYGNVDHAALRLVTCGGPFDAASGHYLDNIIVLASLTSVRTAGPTRRPGATKSLTSDL